MTPYRLRNRISIHAPRVGSDLCLVVDFGGTFNFNPRSPCGERLIGRAVEFSFFVFQSTLPVWGATRESGLETPKICYFNPRSPCGERPKNLLNHLAIAISIHAPRVGSDMGQFTKGINTKDFNPRSPCGERQQHYRYHYLSYRFQSTLPVWGATSTDLDQ